MKDWLSRSEMIQRICKYHYTHSIPSGDSLFCQYQGAIVIFSRPANNQVSRWLLGEDNLVWELSRLWAPDGHEHNLLTQAVSAATKDFLATLRREGIARPQALISYADPNAGHSGRIYHAASWIYLGQSTETRIYQTTDGLRMARRAFHCGDRFLTKGQIEALGFTELKQPGKHRFAKGLSGWARKKINRLAAVSATVLS